jgi:hypothetical protein
MAIIGLGPMGMAFIGMTATHFKPFHFSWKVGHTSRRILGRTFFSTQEARVFRFDGKKMYPLEFPRHYVADPYFAESPSSVLILQATRSQVLPATSDVPSR